MKLALTVLLIVNIAVAGMFWVICPGEVAIHFGVGGQPDSWAPAWANFLILVGVNLLIFFLMTFAPMLAKKTPAKFVNLPHKDYWLSDEHKAQAYEKLTRNSQLIGVATLMLLFVVTLLAMQANLSDPAIFNEGQMLIALGIYIACVIIWIIKFYSDFKLPKKNNKWFPNQA